MPFLSSKRPVPPCALERTSAYDVTSSNERTAADAIAGPYQLTTPH